MRIRIIRLERQGTLIAIKRLAMAALVLERDTEIVVGFGLVRLRRQHPPVEGDRLSRAAELDEQHTKIVAKRGVIGG